MGADVPIYPSRGTQIEGAGIAVPVTIVNGGSSDFPWNGVDTWLSI